MKIMIIDDSKHIQTLVADMLKEMGHETVGALDGQEAINILKDGTQVDLILLDWNMPNIDGPSFLKANQDESLTLSPIVMMTTETGLDKITKAIELGAKEYIMKPFTQDIIESKIKMVTE